MSPRYRHCLLLLLVVLISHAALTLHVNSHVAAEQQACDLCTHYSNFEHAPPPPAAEPFPRGFDTPEPPRTVAFIPAAGTVSHRQRAPPLSA